MKTTTERTEILYRNIFDTISIAKTLVEQAIDETGVEPQMCGDTRELAVVADAVLRHFDSLRLTVVNFRDAVAARTETVLTPDDVAEKIELRGRLHAEGYVAASYEDMTLAELRAEYKKIYPEPAKTVAELNEECFQKENAEKIAAETEKQARRLRRQIEVEFDTIEFLESRGTAPKGRGSWAFSLDRDGKEGLWFSTSSTYGDAKRAAADHFRKMLNETSPASVEAGAYLHLYVQP